ncbi:MAG: S-layer homology domain-containing protein, partial [Ruminiclostridium sp.]|nr:S-layer homology domain-containing protein [Ruminiclostridium sp.]
MRNLKKLVAFIVTLAMIATFAIPAFAAAPTDVVGTAYEGAVSRLVALGVINGYPDGTFGPEDSITRAQFAAIVVRALGYESLAATAAGITKFSDVAANHWGAGYINIAVSLGIIKGYGDGKFGPEDKVTFDQAVTMIVRALGQEAYAEAKGG